MTCNMRWSRAARRSSARFGNPDVIDSLYAYIAPLALGGQTAPGAIGGRGIVTLAEADLRLAGLPPERDGFALYL